MLRLFVAIGLPESLTDRLSGLGGGVPGARWVDPANLHLTLRFIGEVDDGAAHDLDAALAQICAPGFDLVIDGLGQFGGSKPRVVWASVERHPALLHLQAKVESAAVRAGLAPDGQKYTPHITLARLKEASPAKVARFLAERQPFRAGPAPVRRFTLYLSHLTRSGPIYEPAQDYYLA